MIDLLAEADGVIDEALEPADDACVTCSFQAECVVLVHMLISRRPHIPVVFLDTGYHFQQTMEYRDQIATAGT